MLNSLTHKARYWGYCALLSVAVWYFIAKFPFPYISFVYAGY